MQDLRVTNLAVNYDLISWRIGRNRVLIGTDDGLAFTANPPQPPRRPRKDGKPWTPRDEPTGRKLARLRERIALYDAILQSIDSIKALRGAARDTAFTAELDAQRAYFQALKCLNLSHSHAFLGAHKQALALCSRALALSQQTAAAVSSASSTTTTTTTPSAPNLSISDTQTSTLSSTLANLTAHHRGVVALSQLSSSSPQNQPSTTSTAPVVSRLNEFPPSATSPTANLANLVTWPPKLKPVPVKPLFLDVAWNYVEYPGQNKQSVGGGQEGEKDGVGEAEKVAEVVEQVVEKPKEKKGWFGFGR